MALVNGRLDTKDLGSIPAAFHTHGTTAHMQADAADAFLRLAHAFQARFGKRLTAMSFYRPLSDQIRIFLKNYYRYNGPRRAGTTDRSFNGSTYRKRAGMAPVASPGYSNHGLGLAVDLQSGVNIRGSAEHNWMLSTGTRYGFSWDEGRRVNEPWHFRYIASLDVMRGAPKATGTGSSSGPTVADLAATQSLLLDLGYEPGPVDGKLGTRTTTAVTAFQRDAGITADGIPGPTTRKALDTEMATVKAIVTENQRRINEIRAITAENQRRIDRVTAIVTQNQKRIDAGRAQTAPIRRAGQNISLRQEVADAKTLAMAAAGTLDEIRALLDAADVDTTSTPEED